MSLKWKRSHQQTQAKKNPANKSSAHYSSHGDVQQLVAGILGNVLRLWRPMAALPVSRKTSCRPQVSACSHRILTFQIFWHLLQWSIIGHFPSPWGFELPKGEASASPEFPWVWHKAWPMQVLTLHAWAGGASEKHTLAFIWSAYRVPTCSSNQLYWAPVSQVVSKLLRML